MRRISDKFSELLNEAGIISEMFSEFVKEVGIISEMFSEIRTEVSETILWGVGLIKKAM